jgi:transposase
MNESKRKAGSNQEGKGRKSRRGLTAHLKRVNLNAAGIDIGSERHYVAVPADRNEEPVRNFGCLTPDLHEMAKWLKSCGIETVAMESTGVYWIPVAHVLDQYGFDVKLVNAMHIKRVPGRKTDVLDCQWLQELHTFGLLRGAFLPDRAISVLRSYWRHRAGLVESCARQIQHMQKSMEQMNVQLHKVISDITGLTGMKIIRAIIAGERDPVTLAQMKHAYVKNSEETIAKALMGNYREDHLFTLKQAVELYDIYHDKIADCDKRIDIYMATFEAKGDLGNFKGKGAKGCGRTRRKNQPYFNLRAQLYRMTGVDLTKIDGVDAMTAHTVITECGIDMNRFPTEKQFTSYLCLCPNNRITGGKVLKHGTRKSSNRAATALRIAAQSLHHSATALGAFYRRMRMRLGGPKAVTATARKLAILVYRMLKHGEDYVDRGQDYYEKQYQERVIQNLRKRAKSLGCALVPLETCENVS